MQKEPQVEYPAPKDAKPPMKTWRILFLDSAENVKKLKDACKHAGYEVVGALTIEEAWAFLDGKDHADVIVCAAHLEEESMFGFLKDALLPFTLGLELRNVADKADEQPVAELRAGSDR